MILDYDGKLTLFVWNMNQTLAEEKHNKEMAWFFAQQTVWSVATNYSSSLVMVALCSEYLFT